MRYADVAALFLRPLAEPVPEPPVPATPARRLRDALEPLATQGWWSPAAGARIDALGLPFLHAYVWGRAAALGTPAPSVVVAAFGVFEPTVLAAVYLDAAAQASRDDVLALRAEGGAEALATVASPEEADAVARPLLGALEQLDGLARPLFSGLRELPVPGTPAGRLWRAAELVREHRGDGHLAALAASGLDAAEANVLTECWLGFAVGEYSGTRFFGPDALARAVARLEDRGWLADGALTADGRAARAAVEAATDTSQAALVAALGARVHDVVAGAAVIGARLVASGSAPSDPRKRAAG